jgi:hypothetical protein
MSTRRWQGRQDICAARTLKPNMKVLVIGASLLALMAPMAHAQTAGEQVAQPEVQGGRASEATRGTSDHGCPMLEFLHDLIPRPRAPGVHTYPQPACAYPWRVSRYEPGRASKLTGREAHGGHEPSWGGAGRHAARVGRA